MKVKGLLGRFPTGVSAAHELIRGRERLLRMVVSVALFALAGLAICTFVINFDQLQQAAEDNEPTAQPGASQKMAVAGDSGIESAGTSNRANDDHGASTGHLIYPPEVEAWLGPLNRYRAMAGLAPVTADADLSHGDFLHARYLIKTYGAELQRVNLGAVMHTEEPGKPWFTTEGMAAARASDVDVEWNSAGAPAPSWAIDNWMHVPFHRLQILNPQLHSVGYGSYCENRGCAAALNTQSEAGGRSLISSQLPKPIEFPPDKQGFAGGTFESEWPNPLTGCPDYTAPAGLPITLQLGSFVVPGVSTYSLKAIEDGGGALPVCVFDANSYVNPDPMAQRNARMGLKQFGAIVMVPRDPLPAGTYAVSITAGGQQYSWSFSVLEQNGG